MWETKNGVLQDVVKEMRRGRDMICAECKRRGAAVGTEHDSLFSEGLTVCHKGVWSPNASARTTIRVRVLRCVFLTRRLTPFAVLNITSARKLSPPPHTKAHRHAGCSTNSARAERALTSSSLLISYKLQIDNGQRRKRSRGTSRGLSLEWSVSWQDQARLPRLARPKFQ